MNALWDKAGGSRPSKRITSREGLLTLTVRISYVVTEIFSLLRGEFVLDEGKSNSLKENGRMKVVAAARSLNSLRRFKSIVSW